MVYMLFFFQADVDNFSIFLTLLRYSEPLMSPSMMEGLIQGLFCLRKSCAVDLSERVSGVAHLSIPGVIFLKTGFFTIYKFLRKTWLEIKWNTTFWEQRNIFKSSPGCHLPFNKSFR